MIGNISASNFPSAQAFIDYLLEKELIIPREADDAMEAYKRRLRQGAPVDIEDCVRWAMP